MSLIRNGLERSLYTVGSSISAIFSIYCFCIVLSSGGEKTKKLLLMFSTGYFLLIFVLTITGSRLSPYFDSGGGG